MLREGENNLLFLKGTDKPAVMPSADPNSCMIYPNTGSIAYDHADSRE